MILAWNMRYYEIKTAYDGNKSSTWESRSRFGESIALGE